MFFLFEKDSSKFCTFFSNKLEVAYIIVHVVSNKEHFHAINNACECTLFAACGFVYFFLLFFAECGYTSPMMPFCKRWMCKAECWTEAKLLVAKVMEHKCMKGGIKGWCYCRFCR